MIENDESHPNIVPPKSPAAATSARQQQITRLRQLHKTFQNKLRMFRPAYRIQYNLI